MAVIPQTGTWSEGKIVNGVNVGGGVFTPTPAPVPTPTPPVVAPTPSPVSPTTSVSSVNRTQVQRYMESQTPEAKAAQRASAEAAAADERRQRIDAINAIYAPKIAETEAENAGRLASTRARNIAAGLGGSDFGVANREKTTKTNEKILEGVRKEQALAIAEAIGQIDQAMLNKQKFQNEQDKMSYEESQKAFDSIIGQAKSALNVFASGGKTLADLKKDEQTYNDVREITGWSDYEIDQYLHNNAPQPKDAKEYYTPNADGTTHITRVVYNSTTGKMEEKSYDVSTPYTQFSKTEKIVRKDGSVAFYDPATDRLTTISGAITTPVKPKVVAGTPANFTQDDVSLGRQQIQKYSRNGTVDPGIYVGMYKKWVDAGGTLAKFKQLYPPDEFISIADADLFPEFLQPKKPAKSTNVVLPAAGTGTSTSAGRSY